jgi:uncharacterized protein YciI
MKVFAVIRTRGPAWQDSAPLEDQSAWGAHAQFMDDLAAAGIVILAGPLEGTRDVLVIMRGAGSDDVSKKLAADPWTDLDLLRTERIAPWTLRLGKLPGAK